MTDLLSALSAHPASPVQELQSPVFEAAGLRFLVKRDDLLGWTKDSAFCGNKWRKLKYNLIYARENGYNHLITFGGAYSNHLAAVAEAACVLGFSSTAIVRGEDTLPLNPTLRFARDCGTQLVYVSRELYRNKTEPGFLPTLHIDTEAAYVIPEGGTNNLALVGCRELATEIISGEKPDYITLACGTGGTLAGLVSGLDGSSNVLGFSVLKGDFLRADIRGLLLSNGYGHLENWKIYTDYHFGGYAKWKPELIAFMNKFKAAHGIALDPIYTGKHLYGLFDMVAKGFFPPGSTVMAVHTGGLQGVAGFEERFRPGPA